MGIFSLPAGETARDDLESAMRNLQMYRKEKMDYLLDLAFCDLDRAIDKVRAMIELNYDPNK